MSQLTGVFIVHDDTYVSIEDFRINCLVPLCGTRNSHKVLQQFLYCISASHGSSIARERLERQAQSGLRYINYNYLGVRLLVRCNYFDSFCEIIIVEYGKATSPPS